MAMAPCNKVAMQILVKHPRVRNDLNVVLSLEVADFLLHRLIRVQGHMLKGSMGNPFVWGLLTLKPVPAL